MATVLLSVGILGFAFAMIATRILLVKDGEFKGTCSSNNPFLKISLANVPFVVNKLMNPAKCPKRKKHKPIPLWAHFTLLSRQV